jgi:predicted AlkP superfamily phosphohydrolase/phosphomutase
MMTPLHNPTDFEHPTGLLARFARAGIDYTIDPKFKARRGDDGDAMFTDWRAEGRAFVDLLAGITRNRMAAVRLLMDEEPWDAFVCVVVGTDRIQHLHFDRLLPEDGGDPDPMLAGYYRQVDEHLGELAGRLGRDDALLVVSDHGFVRTHGQFMTNEWLLREGWLEPRRARSSPFYPVKRLLGALGITRARLTPLIGEERSSRLQLAASHIDWGRSSAWLGSPFGIRLNVKGRETLGTVDPQSAGAVRDAIAARLADLTDEEGRPLIDSVRSRDDLYQGDALASAPDIVFTFRDDRNYGAYAGEIGHGLYQPTPFKTGDHRIDGVFLAWGGGIRAGAAPRRGAPEPRFQICDVLPTLLHLNGRAVPAVCDGRVRREILTEPGREPVRDPDWRRFLGEKRSVGYGSGQVDEVKERLRELGYLSDAD